MMVYNEKKQNLWKWGLGSGSTIAVFLCVLVIGMTGCGTGQTAVMTNNSEENTVVDRYADDKGKEVSKAKVVEKATSATMESELQEVQEGLAEPENIRNLREYYNVNFVGKTGNALFIDLTGDAEDEMIILEANSNMVNNVRLWGTQELKLSVYKWVNGGVEEIYYAVVNKEVCGEIISSSDINYYLLTQTSHIGFSYAP